MSKVAMPRPRYVALRIASSRPVTRRGLANALAGAARRAGWPDAEAPQLTRFAHPDAIVRVEHTRQAALSTLLALVERVSDGDAQPVRLESVLASGTLRALTARTGRLQERPRRAQQAGPPHAAPPALPRGPEASPGRAPRGASHPPPRHGQGARDGAPAPRRP